MRYTGFLHLHYISTHPHPTVTHPPVNTSSEKSFFCVKNAFYYLNISSKWLSPPGRLCFHICQFVGCMPEHFFFSHIMNITLSQLIFWIQSVIMVSSYPILDLSVTFCCNYHMNYWETDKDGFCEFTVTSQSQQLILKSTFLPNFKNSLKITLTRIRRTENQIDASGHSYVYEWVWADSYILFIYIGFDSIVPERWNSRQKKKKVLTGRCC